MSSHTSIHSHPPATIRRCIGCVRSTVSCHTSEWQISPMNYIYIHIIPFATVVLLVFLSLFRYRYKKNLKAFYIVHPTFWTKMMTWWFTTFMAPAIKAKVHSLPGVEHLYSAITKDQLEIPAYITEYDMAVSWMIKSNKTEGLTNLISLLLSFRPMACIILTLYRLPRRWRPLWLFRQPETTLRNGIFINFIELYSCFHC